ncbi:hypothetical protein B9G55_01930 [Saccharibacillus sp. O16]|nr:hypothetical protein B9G55_01930 [Saccharibacillus sp. O16]
MFILLSLMQKLFHDQMTILKFWFCTSFYLCPIHPLLKRFSGKISKKPPQPAFATLREAQEKNSKEAEIHGTEETKKGIRLNPTRISNKKVPPKALPEDVLQPFAQRNACIRAARRCSFMLLCFV